MYISLISLPPPSIHNIRSTRFNSVLLRLLLSVHSSFPHPAFIAVIFCRLFVVVVFFIFPRCCDLPFVVPFVSSSLFGLQVVVRVITYH